MKTDTHPEITKEISCRVTRTLLMYVRENNSGSLGNLLEGLSLDESYLSDPNNWVSHGFLQDLYRRMIDLLGNEDGVYHMALASNRFQSLGILNRIARLLGSPKLIYTQAPRFNRFLKLNGSVVIHEIGDSWVVLEDRYHDSAQKSRFDCDYTRGVLAGIPTVFGLPLAEVEEIKCQVAQDKYGHRRWPDNPPQGHEGCFYRVRWEPKKFSFLKRFFRMFHDHRQAVEELVKANSLIQSKYDEVRYLATDLETTNQQLVESKQALELQKAKLVKSERKYRLLAENVSDIIWILDLSSLQFEYISPSVEKNRGYTPEEARALSIEQTLSPRSYEQVKKILAAELADDKRVGVDPQRSRRLEIEHSLKACGYTWAEATVSFIRDQDGTPTAIMGVTRDISERKAAERIVTESEKKYRNLFENGSDLICIHDLDGNLMETNIPFKPEYGWKREDLDGINIRKIIPKKYKSEFDKYMQHIITNGSDEGYLKLFTRSGEVVILEYRNKLILDEKGRPKAVQGAARDVTQRIQYEKALRESEKKLQNARKLESLGTLAGGVAHDLNNILSGIISYPDLLLLDIEADSPFRQPLLRIKKSGQKAAEIVQDLLTLARRSVTVKKVLSLNQIIGEFIASPECGKLVGERDNLDLQTNLSDGMLNLAGSETHIAKTVMNLVANAADAMPAGGRITISTRDCYLDKPFLGFESIPQGEYTILEVSDTGIGMPEADLTKIFEPFYTKKVLGRSGTGLGMSVVWGTVKDHDGYIDIITEEGTGTTFALYFPASRSEMEASESVFLEDYLGKGESILVVDDAPEQRDLTERMMQRLGYIVTTAASGEAAVALIKNYGSHDLLILDMIMPPGMDGLETYRKILEIVPNQKAVIASGYAENARVHETQRIGAGGYVKKPFTLEKIGLAVRAELDHNGR